MRHVAGSNVGGTTYTPPATLYISLHTGDPLPDASGNNEVSGGSYARQSMSFVLPAAGTGTTDPGAMLNNSVTFATSTGIWGTVTYIAIWDALSGGNMLATLVLATAKTIGTATTFSFPSANVSLAFS